MDPIAISVILGIIGFVGGLITNGINQSNVNRTNQSNQQIARETNEASALLAQQQHQWNVEDYERELRDSSPASQMQRFRDAGLNPSLIYGQMSSGPSIESTNMPSMTAIPNQAFQAVDPTQSLQNSASDMLSIAQARKTEVETDIMKEKLPYELRVLQSTDDQIQANISSLNSNTAEAYRRIQSMDIDDQLKVAEKERLAFQSDLETKQFNLDKERFELEKLNSSSQRSLNAANRRNLDSLTKLNKRRYIEDLRTWRARLLGFDLNNEKVLAELGLTKQMLKNAELDGELLGFQVDSGRANNVMDKAAYDNLSGANGEYLRIVQWLNLRLTRDLKSLGDSGRLLFRIGK